MSLISSLYTGVTGLKTSQNALNTTAHNLTNVNTSGYTRQQVVQADRTYSIIGTTSISALQVGSGVDIATVRQVRSIFLDKSYRQELGRQSFYEAQSDTVDEIESLFGETEGVSFQDSITDFWEAIQELTKTPDSSEVRATVVETAQAFLERAQSIMSQLQTYQESLNTEVSEQVDRINEIASEIKTLNDQICAYESDGVETASDLRDQRNALLDELGGIISISYSEDSNGVVTVTAEGMPLVSKNGTYLMGTAKASDTSDLLVPVWTSLGGIAVYDLTEETSSENNTDIGSLKGLLISRGSDTANYTDIPDSSDYDTDEEYEAALEEYYSNVSGSSIMTIMAQLDTLVNGIVTAINDILCPNTQVTLASDVTLADGTVLTAGTTITVLDEENAPVGMDDDSTMGEELFCRTSTSRYSDATTVTITNEDGSTSTVSVRIYNEEDASDETTLYTITQLEINSKISSDYSVLALTSNDGTGDIDQDVADALSDIWENDFTTASPDSLTGCTFMEYYTAFTGSLATKGEEYDSMVSNQETLVSSIDDERQSIMGVSSDEELTNLIKYQYAYNASSRFINAINEMMEDLLNKLG